MTGQLIDDLRAILEPLHPDYRFEYDEAAAMNIKADSLDNRAGLIYIEEIQQGRYRLPQSRAQGFFNIKETAVSVYFIRFSADLDPYAGIGNSPASQAVAFTKTQTRQAIRDRIEQEVVMPFMQALHNDARYRVGDFAFSYPPHPRFDSNEVSVLLSFNITQQSSCLETLK